MPEEPELDTDRLQENIQEPPPGALLRNIALTTAVLAALGAVGHGSQHPLAGCLDRQLTLFVALEEGDGSDRLACLCYDPEVVRRSVNGDQPRPRERLRNRSGRRIAIEAQERLR